MQTLEQTGKTNGSMYWNTNRTMTVEVKWDEALKLRQTHAVQCLSAGSGAPRSHSVKISIFCAPVVEAPLMAPSLCSTKSRQGAHYRHLQAT